MGTCPKMSRLEQLALEESIIRDQMAGSNFSLARALTERLREINSERESILRQQQAAQVEVVVVEKQTVELIPVVPARQRRFPFRLVILTIVLLCIGLVVLALL